MMALNPKHRPSVEQVLKHPWMLKEKATSAELLSEFTSRKQVVDETIKKEQEARREERAKQPPQGKIRVRRGHGDQAEVEEASRVLCSFEDFGQEKQTQFFTSSKCDAIFQALMSFLEKSEVQTFSISEQQWKLKFELKGIKIACVLYQVSEGKLCVDFTRMSGDALAFFETYKDILRALEIHNDETF